MTPTEDAGHSALSAALDVFLPAESDGIANPTLSSVIITRTILDEAIAGTLDEVPPDSWGLSPTPDYPTYLALVFDTALNGLVPLDAFTTEFAALTENLAEGAEVTARRLAALPYLVRGRDAGRPIGTPSSDPDGTQLAALLDEILPAGAPGVEHPNSALELVVTREDLDNAIAGLLAASVDPPFTNYRTYVRWVLEAALEGHGDMADFATRLAAELAPLDDEADADEVAARRLWTLQRLAQWKLAEGLVVSHFSAALSSNDADLTQFRGVAFQHLAETMPTPSGRFGDWVDLWLHADFRAAGYTLARAGDLADAVRLGFASILSKVTRLVARLGLDRDDVAFWVGTDSATSAVPTGWALWSPSLAVAEPPDPETDLSEQYATVKALADYARLRTRLPGTVPTLGDLAVAVVPGDPEEELSVDDFSEFLEMLAERTGWSLEDLQKVEQHIQRGGDDARPRVTWVHQFLDAVELVQRIAADPETIVGWTGPLEEMEIEPLGAPEASEIVLAARSRYGTPEAWAKVARPIRDQLRKAQRDALVAYLITRSGAEVVDADDLFGTLLIDPLMNPEMLTARIKQATSSVQLYIQRNMVGIEDGVTFNDEDRSDWEWMKNYRVWEAARKVFLYPENWIEPELRDDKTPFFRTMESELSQGDVTQDRAEEAALAYLDRLNEVAHPQVLAYFAQRETTTDSSGEEEIIDILHVFARSRGATPTYWYRRWEDQRTWTPWEKIECGVAGTVLTPVVFERRLLLFWFQLDESGSDEENPDPQKWYSIRLAWSEYRNGKWQAKNEAEDALSLESTWVASSNTDTGTQRASDLPRSRFLFLSSESEDGVLTLQGIGWNTSSDTWYKIGSFSMDPCTRTTSASPLANEEYIESDQDAMEFAAEYWDALPTDTERSEILSGVTELWDDLPSSYTVNFQPVIMGLLLPQYMESLLIPTGKPQVLTRLQREDEEFVSPGFAGLTDGGDHLTIWLGAVDEDLRWSISYGASEVKLLESLTTGSVVLPTQFQDFVSQVPFFVDTGKRSYMVVRESASSSSATSTEGAVATLGQVSARAVDGTASGGGEGEQPAASTSEGVGLYRFDNFFHPFVCTFIKEVRREGIANLLAPSELGSAAELSRQQLEGDPELFDTTHAPTANVKTPYPWDEIDFSEGGSYSSYNWELFFHLPFYVANRLTDNQRFEEAHRWYSYIFDPLGRAESAGASAWADAPARFWKVKPFLEPVSAPITDWAAFAEGSGSEADADAFERQVEEWRDDPFNPHLLARLRPGTYQKSVVMKFIDNLLAWGDNLFTRDTLETINEATQYYLLAKEILGDRPEKLTPPTAVVKLDFETVRANELAAYVEGAITSPLVWIESMVPIGRWEPFAGSTKIGSFKLRSTEPAPSIGRDTYFCIPPNPKLLAYWNTVDDRLFKIRNSLNIEGVFRTLPLYEPPIDPALLVRASALGVSLATVLADLDAPLPAHRYGVTQQRAQALAASVRALGGALLAALEKRDAETLALLRQGQEIALLELVRTSKLKAIDEAGENLAATKRSKVVVQARRDYYKGLIDKGWIGEETAAAVLTQTATALESLQGSQLFLSGVFAAFPEILVGTLSGTMAGGKSMSEVQKGVAGGHAALSAQARGQAGYLATTAGYKRRLQEWKHQHRLAEREITQIERQIAAAEIRLALTRHELTTHDKQTRQSDDVRSWMEAKFTNVQLYDWMVSQLSASYYQCYQLAHRAGKRAERAYNHELGRSDQFIGSAYWDSTRKGLLAGEILGHDLDRMDAAHAEKDLREHEMTKHIALARLDPLALERLRSDQGECYFVLPEAAFDLDCPGHYFRRIQSVAISIAAVTGQHGTLNAQLTLHGGEIRTSTTATELESDGFSDYPSIVTSVATQDAGTFQVDLRDPRYLPFERRGAVSRWHLKLTAQVIRQVDWSSITDVVLHLRYTARDGGIAFAAAREAALDLGALEFGFEDLATAAKGAGAVFVMSAKRDDPDALYALQQAGSASTAFSLEVTDGMLGTLRDTTLEKVLVIPIGVSLEDEDSEDPDTLQIAEIVDGIVVVNDAVPFALDTVGGVTFYAAEPEGGPAGTYTLSTTASATDLRALDDLLLVLVLT